MLPGSISTLPDTDPDPTRWYGSDRIRIRNTANQIQIRSRSDPDQIQIRSKSDPNQIQIRPRSDLNQIQIRSISARNLYTFIPSSSSPFCSSPEENMRQKWWDLQTPYSYRGPSCNTVKLTVNTVKVTVCLISSHPACKDGNTRFLMVPLKHGLIQF